LHNLTAKEVPVRRDRPLILRLYHEPVLYELARVIGYAGVAIEELTARIKPLVEKFGKQAVESALYHLTTYDTYRAERTVRLRQHVRQLCFQLLGPPPEHPLHEYIKGQSADIPGRVRQLSPTPKAEEPPPAWPVKEDPVTSSPPRPAGISPEGYAEDARRRNKRQLLCMLRDGRKKLAHHGKRSFAGKEAKKEVAAAEAELRRRGLTIPPESQETTGCDRKKGKGARK
jgi:hypothetical protein